MIDQGTFREMMALISDRTPNVPTPETLTIYYAFLSPRLDDQEFREAAMAIFADSEFFPAPVRFLEIRSSREWPKVMDLLMEFTPPHVTEGWGDRWSELSEESRQAVVQHGGPLAFKGLLDKDLLRARTAFVKAYAEVARDAAVDALVTLDRPPEPALLESGE